MKNFTPLYSEVISLLLWIYETRIINKKGTYLCIFYNGSEFTSFLLKDFINSNDMIKVAISITYV